MERYEENPVLDRLRPDCISCLLKKYMASIPEEAPDEKKRQFMQKMMRILADAKAHVSAPVLSRLLDEQLEVSEDPLRLALQYAMVGNYIDFGAVGIVDETYLTALLK
ncbi:MAG: hypothetical protein IJ468_09355, partial [Lachnospiraceae bacterium]|nr:hypothetical protein [Lachnospiraceae bacterium]